MIKIVTLFSIYGLSANRLLLQQTTNANPNRKPLPPGHEYGAFDQFCPHAEPGSALCETTTDIAQDLSSPGSLICETPGSCCLCSAIECGSDPTTACGTFSVGDKGAYGVQTIDIRGGLMSSTLIDCKGELSCADSFIRASDISKIQCSGPHSCQNAIFLIDNPNEGFELNCDVTGACDGLSIALNIPGPPADIQCMGQPYEFRFGAIECLGVGGCKNMKFFVNNDGCDKIVIESIECRDGACEMANFQFNGNVHVETCSLSGEGPQPLRLESCFVGLNSLTCPDYGSCFHQNRLIIDPVSGFGLKCLGEGACEGATFTIDISNEERSGTNIPIFVDCIEGNSCKDINVIVNNANAKQVKISLHCLKEGSCENVTFTNSLNVVIENVVCTNPVFCMGCRANGELCNLNAAILPALPNIPNGPVVV